MIHNDGKYRAISGRQRERRWTALDSGNYECWSSGSGLDFGLLLGSVGQKWYELAKVESRLNVKLFAVWLTTPGSAWCTDRACYCGLVLSLRNGLLASAAVSVLIWDENLGLFQIPSLWVEVRLDAFIPSFVHKKTAQQDLTSCLPRPCIYNFLFATAFLNLSSTSALFNLSGLY